MSDKLQEMGLERRLGLPADTIKRGLAAAEAASNRILDKELTVRRWGVHASGKQTYPLPSRGYISIYCDNCVCSTEFNQYYKYNRH